MNRAYPFHKAPAPVSASGTVYRRAVSQLRELGHDPYNHAGKNARQPTATPTPMESDTIMWVG